MSPEEFEPYFQISQCFISIGNLIGGWLISRKKVLGFWLLLILCPLHMWTFWYRDLPTKVFVVAAYAFIQINGIRYYRSKKDV